MRSAERIPLTGAQIRAARALIRWSAEELAERCKLGVATIRRAEAQDGTPSLTRANEIAIRAALEAGGVQFISANGGGPGVRLRDP
jgi:transcriptional regulator with XRE-family HTH domain